MPKEGAKAPDFCLAGIDESGKEGEFCLSGLIKKGKDIVLYFYPKDNTPGCTQEACDFRDNVNRLASRATVVGVSRDSIASHKTFREKHGLNFPLLSDAEHRIHEAYGAWGQKKLYGKTTMGAIRTTCLIGKDGIIKKLWPSVKVRGHVDEVIEALG
jgi:peroxiredoxin Q/BCP